VVNNSYRQSYDILLSVLRDKTYLHILMKSNTSKHVAKIVFGVMDKYYELDYIIDNLADKKPKLNIKIILMIAGYSILYLETPINVVLNNIHEFLADIGKTGVKSFLDALIRKMDNREFSLPNKSNKHYLEVRYNMPSFLVGLYRKDYPDTFEQIIDVPKLNRVHIRANCDDSLILNADETAIKTLTGYYVNNNKEIAMLSLMGQITYMGYASTLVAESIKVTKDMRILDTCSAPGGKAVMLASKGAKVIACDIHNHRIELITDYAKRMNTKLHKIYQIDATEYVERWDSWFDVVLVDAPCSGLGVINKKKDVVHNRTYEDILSLASLQQDILQNAKNYVKKGGLLVYSTCTVFSIENQNNIAKFLETNKDFTLEKIELPFENNGEIQFLPDGKGMEGFYICHLKRN